MMLSYSVAYLELPLSVAEMKATDAPQIQLSERKQPRLGRVMALDTPIVESRVCSQLT